MHTRNKKLTAHIKTLIAITCAIIFLICLLINYFTKRMVSLNLDEYAKAAAAELRGNAELLYRKMESFAGSLAEDADTIDFLTDYREEDVALLFRVEGKIRQLRALEPSICDIAFVNEKMYYSGIFSDSSLHELQEEMGGQNYGWASALPGEGRMSGREGPVFVFLWNLIQEGEAIGTILISADASAIQGTKPQMEHFYYMLADEGGIRCPIQMPKEKEQELFGCWKEGIGTEDRRQGPYFIHSYYLQNYGCYFVAFLDTENAGGGRSGVSLLVWLCILVLAVSFAILFAMINRGFVRPLDEFCQMLRQIRNTGEHRLQKRPHPYGYAEMEEISREFYGMMYDMEQMNRKIFVQATNLYELEIQKKEAELSFLRSQIDPHFFYNTLEAVRHMALAKRVPEIAQMAVDMGKIFRYSVKGGDFVKLKEEIAIIKSYLQIHKMRFGNKIQAYYFISPETLSVTMPKMLLQPLVENAVFHGIEPAVQNGRIYISAWEEGDALIFTVKDDGVGIPQEKLLEIRSRLDAKKGILIENEKTEGVQQESGDEAGALAAKEKPEPEDRQQPGDGADTAAARRSHVGLLNVHTRVRLYYGEGYGVSLASREGEGTAVTVRIKRCHG